MRKNRMRLDVPSLVRIVLWIVFALAVAGMVWWTFVWPVAAPVAADGRAARVGCIVTLWAFLAALAGLLWLRGWRCRPKVFDDPSGGD